ncbi:MAG: cyclic nucleotide-binding domain-containing protein [Desulfofustis sp.]|jgi:CRP-like cAMP-binding protein|nr:cyclic nucleotide-binding domain-containing protein [Desulfofustis sp.]
MGFPRILFRLIENRRCPLYQYGDEFSVTGVAISMNNGEENSFITTSVIHSPAKKKICKILTGDLTRIVIQYERGDKIPVCLVSCSGCTGSIKLEHSSEHRLVASEQPPNANEIGSMMHLFSDFAFFKNIDNQSLDKVVRFFRLTSYEKGAIVLRKGDIGGNFYIIVTGSVNVINEAGITISKLGKGDVFGEMSLICNDKVSATIQVREDTSILYIDQTNFKKILDHFPSVQLYFSRLMASRLNKANMIRSEDLSSGMIGSLTEIPAEALFQTLNMNSKTGILTISELSRGTARFSFRQGSLIKAKYDTFSGEAAFYEILKEHQGRFRFTPGIPPEDFEIPEIGYFMKLLMEGMRRIDEIRSKVAN